MSNKKRKARWWASRGEGKMVRLFGELVRERAWTTTPHPTPLADFERIRDLMASHSVPFDDAPLPSGPYKLQPHSVISVDPDAPRQPTMLVKGEADYAADVVGAKYYRLCQNIDIPDHISANAVIVNQFGAWLGQWEDDGSLTAMFFSDELTGAHFPAPSWWREVIANSHHGHAPVPVCKD